MRSRKKGNSDAQLGGDWVAPRLLAAARMSRAKEPDHIDEVAIVSTNRETLDRLEAYLRGAGVVVRCTREIDDCLRCVPAGTRAVVLFPDDFRPRSVLAALTLFAEQRPRT